MACELQESCSKRATFIDNFIERQVKILTDPVIGNIQDAPSVTTEGVICKHSLQPRPGRKGTSFATTVAPAERKTCICFGGLDLCLQLGKRPNKENIGFLREHGVCFGCLCIGHISKVCRKRITCDKFGLKHPHSTFLQKKRKRTLNKLGGN